jgi:hypothetical protein
MRPRSGPERREDHHHTRSGPRIDRLLDLIPGRGRRPRHTGAERMATSLATNLPDIRPHLRGHVAQVLTTAEGVTLGALFGVTLGSLLSYWVQHHLRLQSAHITGRVDCREGPLAGAEVVLVGEYGPANNAVYSASTAGDGTFHMDVAPGLYSASIQPPGAAQITPGIVQVDSGGTARVVWAGC